VRMTEAVQGAEQRGSVQGRIVRVLVAGQVLAGLGQGATLSIGAVLATEVSGSEAWAGAGATVSTLGAAVAAIPLAALAVRFGRRPALSLGALIAALGSVITVVATGLVSFPLLLAGFALLGVGAAVGLQARFAATDAADPSRRGRDLSVVVWSTTVGAIVGPNLFGPGVPLAEALGLPELTGSFVIAIAAQLLAAALYLVALRPDPLAVAANRPVDFVEAADAGIVRGRAVLVFAIATLALSHATMVSIMAMTPVHLIDHGASLVIVGFTISLHIAGMFGLSPLFGWASDKLGRFRTILLGQSLFAVSILITALGEGSTSAVTVGLVLLGLGWSASTVAGSALLAESVAADRRAVMQGRSDLAMNGAGALGGALAGPALILFGYSGLAVVALFVVALTVSLAIRLRTVSRR